MSKLIQHSAGEYRIKADGVFYAIACPDLMRDNGTYALSRLHPRNQWHVVDWSLFEKDQARCSNWRRRGSKRLRPYTWRVGHFETLELACESLEANSNGLIP